MDYDKIKELIEWMGKSELTSLDIEFPDGVKINMKKDSVKAPHPPKPERRIEEHIVPSAPEEKEAEEEGNIVKAPMVGTFYLKPSPTSEPYVTVGQNVKKGDTLCIIEAMKLMNEIESEFTGKIVEILVKDGEAVEYGKPLFRIA